ncbi:MAG: GAF domain-containing protein [Desulfobacula sp.]|nr:GAF domain-containing protein [Desulfobacula sp.]
MADEQLNILNKKLTGKTIRQLYQESRMARRRLLTLLEYLPDPVLAFALDNKVEYINPAFERIFGWTLKEIKDKNIDFVPEHLAKQAKEGVRQLYKNKSVHDFETQRLTKDGRILDIVINGAILYDEDNQPMGQALILRDMTYEKRMAKSNQVMFKISNALHQIQNLGDLIFVITKEIRKLISVEGAFILLSDASKNELYFLSAHYKDGASEKQFKKIRFPADQGVAGRVYKTGKPLIISDVSKCAFYLNRVDEETDLETKNMLSVPMKLSDRTIGVVSVVNKRFGDFDTTDRDLLSMVASTIALPIENTRINEKLRQSYLELQSLNQVKDRVINHLAHELKTPISVLGASMTLLSKKLSGIGFGNDKIERIFLRGQRNLTRILDIQYEVEDLLRKKEFKAHHILQRLLDACKDEISILFENQTDNDQILESVQKTINKVFGPQEPVSETIDLKQYLENQIATLQTRFTHRKCIINMSLENCRPINMPRAILDIIIEGIIQNAVEYTPDGSKIDIILKTVRGCPQLVVKDSGIGITKETLHLIFDNFFTPPKSTDYSTKTPFDFNAGGRGFDLLRIKLFSERYPFSIQINSKRCPVIPRDTDLCPGDIKRCNACSSNKDCYHSGGTAIHIRFE